MLISSNVENVSCGRTVLGTSLQVAAGSPLVMPAAGRDVLKLPFVYLLELLLSESASLVLLTIKQ